MFHVEHWPYLVNMSIEVQPLDSVCIRVKFAIIISLKHLSQEDKKNELRFQ